MGAGASASQVREHVEGLGNAYQPYGTTLEDNGVDGALVEELAHDDRLEPLAPGRAGAAHDPPARGLRRGGQRGGVAGALFASLAFPRSPAGAADCAGRLH